MLNVERLLPNITPKIILLSAFMCICLWFVFVDYNIAGMKSFFTFMSGVFVTEWFTAFLRTKDKKENSRLPIPKPDSLTDEEWEQLCILVESNPLMTMKELTILVTDFIENSNKKDGVKFILQNGKHSFECLKCNKIHNFKYDAMKCCNG